MKVLVEFTQDLDWPETHQVMVSEDCLPLTKAEMRSLRITPKALKEVFAEARELAKDIKPGDSVRIIADRLWRGKGRHYCGRSKDDFLVAPCRWADVMEDVQ